MADYRTFCHSCNNEIGFGSHKPGCAVVQEIDNARREKARFEKELRAACDELDNETLLDELAGSWDKVGYLGDALAAEEKRFRFLKEQYVYRESVRDAIKNMKDRGIRL